MDQIIQIFKALRRKLHAQSLNPLVEGTMLGQAHLKALSDEITKLGKMMERNGVDIEKLNKELKDEGY